MESDTSTLSNGEATGGTPFEEPNVELPPPQQAADHLPRDRRHPSGSASIDNVYPAIPTEDETRINQCMDTKDQEGQELLMGWIQRDLETRRHGFNRRRRAKRAEKDALILELHAQLAKSESYRKKERKAAAKARLEQKSRGR